MRRGHGRGMRAGGIRTALLLAAALALWAPVQARAQQQRFLVGAASVDTTPPPLSSGADGAAFASCPAGLDGPRPFAFEEPYRDVNGNGRFDYGEPYCDAPSGTDPTLPERPNGRYDG